MQKIMPSYTGTFQTSRPLNPRYTQPCPHLPPFPAPTLRIVRKGAGALHGFVPLWTARARARQRVWSTPCAGQAYLVVAKEYLFDKSQISIEFLGNYPERLTTRCSLPATSVLYGRSFPAIASTTRPICSSVSRFLMPWRPAKSAT